MNVVSSVCRRQPAVVEQPGLLEAFTDFDIPGYSWRPADGAAVGEP